MLSILEAARRLRGRVRRTPLVRSAGCREAVRRRGVAQARVPAGDARVQDSRRAERGAVARRARRRCARWSPRRPATTAARWPKPRVGSGIALHGVHAAQAPRAPSSMPIREAGAVARPSRRRTTTRPSGSRATTRARPATSSSPPTTIRRSSPAPAPSASRSSRIAPTSTPSRFRWAAAGWRAASGWRSRRCRRRAAPIGVEAALQPGVPGRARPRPHHADLSVATSLADGLTGNIEPARSRSRWSSGSSTIWSTSTEPQIAAAVRRSPRARTAGRRGRRRGRGCRAPRRCPRCPRPPRRRRRLRRQHRRREVVGAASRPIALVARPFQAGTPPLAGRGPG